VTLNPGPIRDWDDTDQLNLRLLIQISIYVIFFLKSLTKDMPSMFCNAAIGGGCIAIAQVVFAWHGSDVARETMCECVSFDGWGA
jgi:hypothetical protein